MGAGGSGRPRGNLRLAWSVWWSARVFARPMPRSDRRLGAPGQERSYGWGVLRRRLRFRWEL